MIALLSGYLFRRVVNYSHAVDRATVFLGLSQVLYVDVTTAVWVDTLDASFNGPRVPPQVSRPTERRVARPARLLR